MATEICKSHEPDGTLNPRWLEERKKGVTASEAAQLLAGKSWMALWAKKTGRIEPDDLSDNEFVRWGNKLEPVIIDAYGSEQYANRKTRKVGALMRNDEYPWMLATLDAETEHPVHRDIPLEVKNNNAYREDEWADGAPIVYLWQARHQAVTMGAPACSIACLLGGNKLVWADDELQKVDVIRVLKVTEEFWWHVTNDIPPKQVDGRDDTKRALHAAFDRTEGVIMLADDLLALDHEYDTILAELALAKEHTKPLDERKKEIENTFKRAMEHNSKGMLGNGVAWTIKRIERKAYQAKASSYDRVSRKVAKR